MLPGQSDPSNDDSPPEERHEAILCLAEMPEAATRMAATCYVCPSCGGTLVTGDQ